MVQRIEPEVRRFKQIVRGKVKDNLKKYISRGEIIAKEGDKVVSIPLPQIELPKFRYGSEQGGGVGQGEGEEGTPLGKQPGEEEAGEAGDQPGQHILEVEVDAGEVEFEATRLRYSSQSSQRYRIVEGDPLSASIEYRADFAFARDDWQVRTESRLAVTCDATQFYLDGRTTCYEGTEVVSQRTWKEDISRIAY